MDTLAQETARRAAEEGWLAVTSAIAKCKAVGGVTKIEDGKTTYTAMYQFDTLEDQVAFDRAVRGLPKSTAPDKDG